MVVCVVAFLFMRPQDISKVAYWYKYFLKKVMEIRAIAQESIDEINEGWGKKKMKKVIKQEYIVDVDHKPQESCDSNPLECSTKR